MVSLLNPNPWEELPEDPPYVLSRDRAAVEAWNAKAPQATRIHTNLLPDPQLGNPLRAAVIVLVLNPSLDEGTAEAHRDRWLIEQMREAMTDVRDLFCCGRTLPKQVAAGGGATNCGRSSRRLPLRQCAPMSLRRTCTSTTPSPRRRV